MTFDEKNRRRAIESASFDDDSGDARQRTEPRPRHLEGGVSEERNYLKIRVLFEKQVITRVHACPDK